jgi:hypothetical protein
VFYRKLFGVRQPTDDFKHDERGSLTSDWETGHGVIIELKGAVSSNENPFPRSCQAKRRVGKKKKEWGSLTELQEYLREQGRIGGKLGGKIGGKTAAKNMTKAARTARAKRAAAASAKVRTAKAKAKRKPS